MDSRYAQFAVKPHSVPHRFSVPPEIEELISAPLDRYNFELELNVSNVEMFPNG
jgi:hypothetical protein